MEEDAPCSAPAVRVAGLIQERGGRRNCSRQIVGTSVFISLLDLSFRHSLSTFRRTDLDPAEGFFDRFLLARRCPSHSCLSRIHPSQKFGDELTLSFIIKITSWGESCSKSQGRGIFCSCLVTGMHKDRSSMLIAPTATTRNMQPTTTTKHEAS